LNRVSSIFSQLLQWFPRGEFEALVRKHGAERRSKGFSCWGQFVAMLFCQLGQAKSLREIHEGLRASEGRLRHLGLTDAPPRSTLAYANQHRTHRLFEELFQVTFQRCQAQLQAAGIFGKAAMLGHRLFSLDATVIDLCAAVFDWAKFRTTKGAVKLHLLLDHEGHLPAYAVITPGKQHEIRVARRLKLPPGSMLVFDRGYTDYDWFAALSRQKVFFVTRRKEQADFVVVERRAVTESERKAGVRRDEILVFRQQATADNDRFFRRVVYWDAEKEREFVFLTNHLDLAPSQVAAVYKQRWQVELFFKALKQNLRVKTFIGTSANALKIQIWTALISILLIKFLQLRSRLGWSLSRLVALLRQQLFVYRDLWRWIDHPFEGPPQPVADRVEQLAISW